MLVLTSWRLLDCGAHIAHDVPWVAPFKTGGIVNDHRPVPPYRSAPNYPPGVPRTTAPVHPRAEGIPGNRIPLRPPDRMMSVKDAAARLGVSKMTLYRMIHENGFPAAQMRGRYAVPARVVDEIIRAVGCARSTVDVAEWVKHHHRP